MNLPDTLSTAAWGMHHFGSICTGGNLRLRDIRRAVAKGFMESVGMVSLRDDDGFTVQPERYVEGFQLTAAGKAELRRINPLDADTFLGKDPGAVDEAALTPSPGSVVDLELLLAMRRNRALMKQYEKYPTTVELLKQEITWGCEAFMANDKARMTKVTNRMMSNLDALSEWDGKPKRPDNPTPPCTLKKD